MLIIWCRVSVVSLTRNFTDEEWRRYVGSDIQYEETCDRKDLSIKVKEKIGE
ncbi:MAG: hypothetical protein R2744_13300 [Bacteroidales bacterium]